MGAVFVSSWSWAENVLMLFIPSLLCKEKQWIVCTDESSDNFGERPIVLASCLFLS